MDGSGCYHLYLLVNLKEYIKIDIHLNVIIGKYTTSYVENHFIFYLKIKPGSNDQFIRNTEDKGTCYMILHI